MERMRRATRGLSATSSGGSFSAAEATTLGGSSGEKMRALAALSTGSWQATVARARVAARANLGKRVTTPPAPSRVAQITGWVLERQGTACARQCTGYNATYAEPA